MADFLVFDGPVLRRLKVEPGQRVLLGKKLQEKIGPGEGERTYSLDSLTASKHHGILSCDESEQLWYEDEGSTNGSWLRIEPHTKCALPANFGLMLGNEVTVLPDSAQSESCDSAGIQSSDPESLLDILRQRFAALDLSFEITDGQTTFPASGNICRRYPLMNSDKVLLVRSDHATFNDVLERQIQPFVFHYNSARAEDDKGICQFVAKSPGRREALLRARRIAGKRYTVLISGPTGCGKEVLAELIHKSSPRANRPFLPVNCAALPENLFEAELFGYAKGIHNLANCDKEGIFEAARGGTVVLDEIQALPRELQPKLLRVLECSKVRRIGESAERNVDVRIIALTNENLDELVRQGTFREDLYQRLNVLTISIPAIVEEDIRVLVPELLDQIKKTSDNRFTRMQRQQLVHLAAARKWPGNVRQLYHSLVAFDALYDPGCQLQQNWELAAGESTLGPEPAPEPVARAVPASPEPIDAARTPAAQAAQAAKTGMPAARTLHQFIFLSEARAALVPPRPRGIEQLARRLGISSQAVSQRLKKMKAPPWNIDPEFRIWVDKALLRLRGTIRPGQPYLMNLIADL